MRTFKKKIIVNQIQICLTGAQTVKKRQHTYSSILFTIYNIYIRHGIRSTEHSCEFLFPI